jgi:hypothetical protein
MPDRLGTGHAATVDHAHITLAFAHG